MRSKSIFLFILIGLVIIFLQIDLLKPVFDIGLTPEDWEFILRYKTFELNPLTKIFEVWASRGAYSTIPIYYLGIVESFTGFNYYFIQLVGVCLKILSTLLIFPLILLVFKNIWLATLTSILFAISYTTTGTLETGVEPSEYLGLLIMNIFLITYYFLHTKYFLNIKWLLLTSFLLFAAVTASVMRVFPLLFFLPLIELFLFLLNSKKYKLKYLLIKLGIIYLPIIFLFYSTPTSASGHFSLPKIISSILEGNWHLLLTPIQGLGHIIPVGKYYNYLGILQVDTFSNYLTFLLGGPLVIFSSASLIASWIISKNPILLFLRIFLLNFVFGLLSYWIIQHRLLIPPDVRLNFDLSRVYPILFGLFILTLAINYFIDWYKEGKKNDLILILWLGPFMALFYITMTYFFTGVNLSFGGAQDHYLLIPTIGISLFLSGILLLLFRRLSTLRLNFVGLLLIMLIITILYGLNREMIYNYFNAANINGRAASGQELIQKRIKQKLRDLDYAKPLLVYFDTSEITDQGPFYSEGLLTPFPFFMHLDGDEVVDGCIGVIYEDSSLTKLKTLITSVDNQLMIKHPFICVDGYNMTTQDLSIRLQDLYAFKIKDSDFIDIKNQLLDQLGAR